MNAKQAVSIISIFIFALLTSNKLAANELGDDKNASNVVGLNAANYSTETAKGVVLVDFWASWCGPCRRMDPILKKLSIEMKDSLKVGKVDVDVSKMFSISKKVRLLPTLIIYKDGKEMERVEGGISKGDLEKLLEPYFDKDEIEIEE